MKSTTITSFVLVILLAIQAYAGIIIPNLINYEESIKNLITQDNVKSNIKFGGSSAGKLDVYYDKKNTKKLKPVVIFVHGGAWIFGNKYEYAKVGSLFVRENYVGVFPDYVLFPNGSIDDMVNDVHKAVEWTYNNISKYGGDKSNIIISGHSAGAHLIALTAFKSTLRMRNNRSYLSPLPSLKKMVLFNGPYDFDDYDLNKLITGSTGIVENGITERLVSVLVHNDDISPTDVLKSASANSVQNFGMPEIVVYYAGKDQLVPTSSAEELMKHIRRVSPNTTLKSVYKSSYDHFTVVTGAQAEESDQQQLFLEILRM